MDVSIQKIDQFVGIFAFEFYGVMDLVDIIEEFEERFFAACPYEKYIVFETSITKVLAPNSGDYVFILELAHKYISI